MACRHALCFAREEVDEVAKEAMPTCMTKPGVALTEEPRREVACTEAMFSHLQNIERKLEPLQDFKQLLASMEGRLREEIVSNHVRLETKMKALHAAPPATSSENLPTEAHAGGGHRPRRFFRPHAGDPKSLQLGQSKSALSLDSGAGSQADPRALPQIPSGSLNAQRVGGDPNQSFVTLLTALATASYSGKPFPKRLSTTNFSVASATATSGHTQTPVRPSTETQNRTTQSAAQSTDYLASPQGSNRRSKRSSMMQHPDMGRMLMRLQRTRATVQVWNFLETPESSPWARWYVRLMICVILTSVVVTFMQTLSPPVLRGAVAGVAEIAFDVLFVIELAIRFAVCPDRLMFFKNIFNIIDLLASLPLFIRLTGGLASTQDEESTEFAVLVGAVPVFRLLKILRHFEKFQLLLSAFAMAFEALPVLLFTLLVIVMISSFMIYVSEPRSSIESLPVSMWFTIVTMTTVGYGDIVPQTPVGYGVTVGLISISVLYMSIPIGIVGNAFSRVWEDRDRLLLVQRTRDCLLKGGYKPQDIPGLFAIFDRHHSGELSFPAFRRMLAEMKIGLTQDRIVGLFHSFDTNANGTISAEEFVKVLFPEAHAEMYRPTYNEQSAMLDEQESEFEFSMAPSSAPGSDGET